MFNYGKLSGRFALLSYYCPLIKKFKFPTSAAGFVSSGELFDVWIGFYITFVHLLSRVVFREGPCIMLTTGHGRPSNCAHASIFVP